MNTPAAEKKFDIFLKKIKKSGWKAWYLFRFILKYKLVKTEERFFSRPKKEMGAGRKNENKKKIIHLEEIINYG